MKFVFFLIMIFTVFGGVLVDAGEYRAALAADFDSGKLVRTERAEEMIKKGDWFLEKASLTSYRSHDGRHTVAWENDLFEAFIAKVWYERARLEMETRGDKR